MKDHKKHRSSPQREERAGETWGGGHGIVEEWVGHRRHKKRESFFSSLKYISAKCFQMWVRDVVS